MPSTLECWCDVPARRTGQGPAVAIGSDAAVMGGGYGGGGTATLALILVTAVAAAAGARSEVLGYTETVWLDRQGPLRGLVTTVGGDRGLDQVDVYLGVPYAASQERFMPPGESPTWCPKADDGSFDRSHCRPLRADYLRPVCPQRPPDPYVANASNKRLSAARLNYLKRLTPYLGNQSEDCLYLNIYVPHGKPPLFGSFALPARSFVGLIRLVNTPSLIAERTTRVRHGRFTVTRNRIVSKTKRRW